MRPPEYWVVQVMLHKGRVPVQLSMLTPGAYISTMALVAVGDLMLLPDGGIAKPLEVFSPTTCEPAACHAAELEAHEHRRKLLRDHPGADYRVIMNTDITV